MYILDALKDKLSGQKKHFLNHSDEIRHERREHHTVLGFKNPWPSGDDSALPDSFPLHREEDLDPSVKRIKVGKPDFNKVPGKSELQVTWLGHAGVLVQLPPLRADSRPLTLLIDPIFSERASPVDVAGPARRLENPCEVSDLPQIDLLFISHNHFDHMDSDTLDAIIARNCSTTRYVVPLGLKKWFKDRKVPKDHIFELDWWEQATIKPSTFGISRTGEDTNLGHLNVTCVPAQHNSARLGIDKGATLWAGFVIEQMAGKASCAHERTSVYFAGDTGYRGSPDGPTCPAFKKIGDKFGPIDFAAIPIWRGGTLSFIAEWGLRLNPRALTSATHATPEDAVCIHQDVRCQASLGIHFATFAGSEDEATYPISLLEEALRKAGVSNDLTETGGFDVRDVGETFSVAVHQ